MGIRFAATKEVVMTTERTPNCLERADREYIEGIDVPVGLYMPNETGVEVLALSQGFVKTFGLENLETAYPIMSDDMYRDTHPEDRARIQNAAIDFTQEDAIYDVTYRTRIPATGNYVLIRAQGTHIYVRGTRIAVVFYRRTDMGCAELGERLRYESEMHQMEQRILYDELTGLPNFTKFIETAQKVISHTNETERFAMIYANLANTSTLNSLYGFMTGNRLIRQTGELFAKEFGSELCCRPSGDHFMAVCVADDAKAHCETILEEAKGLHEKWITRMHMGIHVIDDGDEPIIIACDKAKHAADREKGTHASTITTFSERMSHELAMKSYVLSNIESAITDGQLQVWYQPVIDTRDRDMAEREALARWILPSGEMISPVRFIPVLEDAKVLVMLDIYVMREVARDLAARRERGEAMPKTSINLSRIDFESADVVNEIARAMDERAIPHDRICVEITESTAITDYYYMHKQMRRLKELGFEIWIDDFGSGFSSFDTLQELEFDLLKIDMSLIRNIPKSKKSKTVVKSIVGMAKKMGLDTLAEGVETQNQRDFLTEIGCGKLQGYLYGRPEPSH